jgi:hypothetical protein
MKLIFGRIVVDNIVKSNMEINPENYILRMANDSIGYIERDGAQELTERQKRVIKYWMVRAMTDMNIEFLMEIESDLERTRQRNRYRIEVLKQIADFAK